MRGVALLVGAAALLAACSGPDEPVGPVVEALGPGREARQVTIATTSPYDFDDGGEAGATEVVGRLVFPPQGTEIRGAAVLSHGSAGPGGRQDRMAEALAEAGVASIVMDHFRTRGIGSTVRDQLRVTAQMMMADAFRAKALLATHPEIAPDRIGVMGWSKGGLTASLAAVERLAGLIAPGARPFAFAVAFYPFCAFDLDEEALQTPLLYLLGGADDWTPAEPCVRQARAWAARGQPAEAVVYEGAPHGFDSRLWIDIPIPVAITVREAPEGCTLTVDAAGRTVSLDGADELGSVEGRLAYLDRCGERGVTFGGQSAAREASRARVLAFVDAALD